MTKIRHIEKPEDDKIYQAFRKALYEQQPEEDIEAIDKTLIHTLINRMVEKEGYNNIEGIMLAVRETNWRLNQAIRKLYDSGIDYPVIVGNLIQQAIEIVYWNCEKGDRWEEFIRELFELHITEALADSEE